jgi:hypothetical protein
MELHDALSQISEIRRQMVRTQVFRGYRSVTVGFSGLLALLAASVQNAVAPNPSGDFRPYLLLWLSTAAVSVAGVAIEMVVRGRRSALAAEHTALAVEQFVPCLVAGMMLTGVVARFVPESRWMLPGLWSIVFSLGAYASGRLLPRPLFWAAGYYLIGGCLCLVYAKGPQSFSPWAMAVPFGGGQLLTAGILYWTLERRHA